VEFPSTCPPHRCDRLIPVTPFVCALACQSADRRPAPPVARTRRSNCLAGTTPHRPTAMRRRRNGVEASPRPTWGTLVRVRLLKHRLDAKPAPDTTPAATLLARLFLSFTAAVTLAGRAWASTLARYVPRLPPRHSFRPAIAGRFQEAEYRSAPLPTLVRALPTRLTSLLSFTGKGLMPLSSLSCSRSAFLGRTPEVVSLRLIGVATARLPTPARVNRTCRALHPIGLATARLWSGSRRGICRAPWARRTRFGQDRPVALQPPACPARPHSLLCMG